MAEAGKRTERKARRPGLVMPIVPRVAAGDESRPVGDALPVLWRKWWEQYAPHRWTKESGRKNARRCEELSRALSDYPSPAEVAVWLAALRSGGLSPGTVQLHKDILHGVFAFGNAACYVHGNPVSRQVCPWRRPERPESHPIRNIAALWPRMLDAFERPRERAFVGVLRYTGARLEEGLGLTPPDVLRGHEPWSISIVRQRSKPNSMESTRVKGKGLLARRVIPIRPELRDLLAPVLDMDPVQLRFGGARWGPASVREVPYLFPFRQPELNAMRERLGSLFPEHFVHGRAWHTFRHTLAFEMQAAGKSTEQIQRVLGHKSVRTTEGYMSRLSGGRVGDDVFGGM